MPDYIPESDAEFLAWSQNLCEYAAAHLADLGLVAADMTDVVAARAEWETARTDCQAKQIATNAAVELKGNTRQVYEAVLRALVRKLQASSAVSDDERRAMQITVRDGEPTPTGAAATHPVAFVSTTERFRHEIRFADAATPTKRAKPAGVMGCEIWVKIGAAPAHASECQLLALDTASPYVVDYSAEEVGKCAYYMLRWISTSGAKGPWSETVAATITG